MPAMTPEQFLALPDDTARNAAIARALGVPFHRGTREEGHALPCFPHWHWGDDEYRADPPPYWTGGDGSPFANWHRLAEMWRFLWEGLGHRRVQASQRSARRRHSKTAGWWRWGVMDREGVLVHAEALPTPHRALCLALVAAGLVPKGE